MRAFVTGSTGLLGTNLVRALVARGHTVRALVRSPRKAAEMLGGLPGVEVVEGDMEDVAGFAESLSGCDVVFHTAAYFREYFAPGDHWPKLHAINVKASVALAEAAHQREVGRFVDVSSSATVGFKADGTPGDEDPPPAPVVAENLYMRSKQESAQALMAFSARTGMPVISILPGWMFGPWDAAPTGAGQLVLDILAGRLPALLEQVSGVRSPRWTFPRWVALGVAYVAETWARVTGGSTLLTVAGVRTMQAKLRVDSSKAARELGATFRPLEDTLRDTVAWYRERQVQAPEARQPRPVTAA
ncbi:NAD-dependent epimerase/dehydratase family protein [Myxococcus sp. 1LA]